MQNARLALRQLRLNPGFGVVAILTLALGIGANTAIFSVLQGVVLAPLPYHDPDRLVLVWLYNSTLKYPTALSYPDFLDWRSNSQSFEQMAAFTSQEYDLTAPGAPEHLSGREVSSGFFTTLGIALPAGREFSAAEDREGGAPVAVISDRLRREHFGDSGQVLGRSLTMNGRAYTVIGVLPSGFHFGTDTREADVYTPLGQGSPVQRKDRAVHNIACVARLRANMTITEAQAEMNTLQENIDRLYPAQERGLLTEIVPLKRQLVEDVSGTLALLFGAVGVVLLIACANVANLLLVRSAKRAREFAVRAALGAQTGHIVRQLLSESVLIALVGGVVGLAVAVAALKIGLASFSTNLPRTGDIGLNPYVLLFALAVSMLAGIVFGLAPVWQTRGVDIQEALKQGGRGSLAGHRVQNALSMAQVAMTLILLAGAGLLFRTIRHLWQVNPGFETHNIVAFKAGLPPDASRSPSVMRVAYSQVLDRLRRLPGVEQADLTTLIPLSDADNSVPFWIGLQKLGPSAEAPRALAFLTGPDYLRVMGIPLLQGRFLAMSDTVNSPHVVVVDEEFARKYFPAGNAVGQSITIANVGAYQIVGVVGHVRHWGLGNPGPYAQLQIYTSFFQLSDEWLAVLHNDTNFVVRTPLDASALMPEIKLAIYAPGAEQPVYDIQRIQQIISHSMSSQRVPMVLLGIFAGLALLLASIGIYGVISYSMAQRVQEIGIRMALGAEKGSILRMVIGEGVKLATAGLTIGVLGSLALARVLSSYSRLLYGVSSTDPLTFVAVAVLILVVTVAACFLPARRATTVDPMVALRCE